MKALGARVGMALMLAGCAGMTEAPEVPCGAQPIPGFK